MLTIVKGSLDDLKAEMKYEEGRVKNDIRGRKKKIKELQKAKPVNTQAILMHEKNMEKDEQLLKMFNSSKVQPVRVGDIVINYAAYLKYLKIVKGITKEYFNRAEYVVRHETGRLELADLGEYFEGFTSLPVAELRDETA